MRAGINRTRLTEPLEPIVVETTPRSLVIGGGIAGLRAALGLAEIGLSVYLVEKEPQLGGWVGGFGDMYPHGRNGAELIAKLETAVREHPAITVFTNAEVMSKSGSFGNYRVTIAVSGEQLETITVDVGSIVVATGFDTYEPAAGEFGYGIDGVVTLPAVQEDGGRGGRPAAVQRPAGQDHRLHLLRRQPPGRRRRGRPHVLLALLLHGSRARGARGGGQGRPGVRQYHLYRDMRTYGKYELLYSESREKGSVYLRVPDDEPPAGREASSGGLQVHDPDLLTGGEEIAIPADLVVLVTGMVPRRERRARQRAQAPGGQGRLLQRDPSQAAAGRDGRGRRATSAAPARRPRTRPRASPPASPR